jgi:1,4-dihydroxy-6-naphthoate synthase
VTRTLTLGISPCPNDVFVFHALLERKLELEGIELRFEIADVEELNLRLLEGRLDASKASFHAALELGDTCIVLRAGAALGFGAGPLLLGRADAPALERARVLCPGRFTTASLLLRLFHPEVRDPGQVIFSEIMPALERGDADYGVCIHEGRFTFAERGLECVEDLGVAWDTLTRAPLPLGGILARRKLGPELLGRLDAAIVASLDYARAHPDEAFASMRRHAQELSERVVWAHVELYVNAFTRDLGDEGTRALATLERVAHERGLVSGRASALAVRASELSHRS